VGHSDLVVTRRGTEVIMHLTELWPLPLINYVLHLAAYAFSNWSKGPDRFLAGTESQLNVYCWFENS